MLVASVNRHELIDAFRVRDDAGQVSVVEVWALVSYSDDRVPQRTVGPYEHYLRDGTRLVRNADQTFTHPTTRQTLRHCG